MSLRQLTTELGISYTTAWRARKRGSFYQNYHERAITIDENWNAQNLGLLQEAASAAILDLRDQYGAKWLRRIERYSETSDLEQEALLYLMQHSGGGSFRQVNVVTGLEARNSRYFLKKVALNLVSDICHKLQHRANQDSFSLDRSDGTGDFNSEPGENIFYHHKSDQS